MKRSKKILASLLCAAMLCIPTLAAGEQDAPGAGAYVPDPQYTVVCGAVTRQDNGSLLVQKPGETKPTDGVVFWTENTMILDAVSGSPWTPVPSKRVKRFMRGWVPGASRP